MEKKETNNPMTLEETKDVVAKNHSYDNWMDMVGTLIIGRCGDTIDERLKEVAELYSLERKNKFLIGKQIRYRYVDWAHGSYTPWMPCTETDLKHILEDGSIESVEFKP